MATIETAGRIPWWREPTKDQWYAWWAAWLGWTLDAFDFTVFLLIMVPIAKEFGVPLTEVTFVLTITLWMRLVGACASGWLADRVGRKTPFMILFIFRALLGIGMGAEWPAGAALAMESWPARSRGIMSGILQGSWSLGFLLSSAVYGLFYQYLGWRGMLWIGILPAFAVVFVRYFVKEPAVWVENRRLQREHQREVRAPLFQIFKRGIIGNTLNACWWMTSAFVIYYSIWSLFATHLQKDLNFSPAQVATPIAVANFLAFLASGFWGWTADHIGRRWSMIIPGIITVFVAPLYLLTDNLSLIVFGFVLQGLFGDALYGQNPSYLSERFPTEVRAAASAFCYHQGAIFGGLVAPVLTYFAINYKLGFGIPMLVGTVVGAISFVLALLLGPETKGKELVSDLMVAPPGRPALSTVDGG